MGNSKGSYHTTPENNLAAFDRLPRSVRAALANADFSWAAAPIRTSFERGRMTAAEIVKAIRKWDTDKHKRDVKRGIVAPR